MELLSAYCLPQTWQVNGRAPEVTSNREEMGARLRGAEGGGIDGFADGGAEAAGT